MGFPKVLAHRLRYTKGTRFYYYRDYLAVAGLLVVSAIGLAFRYTSYIQDFRSDYEKGYYANSPEFEQRKINLSIGPFTHISDSKTTLKSQEEVKNFVNVVIRAGDINS